MTKRLELYKCNVCGNIVEIIHPGSCALCCCSVPMELLRENTNDEAYGEKHVPITVIEGNSKTIRVGTIPHPMEKEHYIVFIESISPDKHYLKRKYLYPGDEPVMEFKSAEDCENYTAREFCNLHGLWSNEKKKEEE